MRHGRTGIKGKRLPVTGMPVAFLNRRKNSHTSFVPMENDEGVSDG